MATPPPFFDPFLDDGEHNFLGRRGPSKVINEFIVGHLYGGLTYEQLVSYMHWVYHDFADVTYQNVLGLWSGRVQNTIHFQYWVAKDINSPEVRQTLHTMKLEWNMWRDLGIEGIMKDLGEE